MPKIVAIELENFQSIKESVRIEFAPITLFFGPNSAGKSAVFDALDLIECIWDPIRFDESRARQMVDRWARKEDGKALPLRLAIEFEYQLDEAYTDRIWDNPENWKCRKAYNRYGEFYIWDDPLGDTLEDEERLNREGYRPNFVELTSDGWKVKKTNIRLEVQIGYDQPEYQSKKSPIINYLSVKAGDQQILRCGELALDVSIGVSESEIAPLNAMHMRGENMMTCFLFNTPFLGSELRNADNSLGEQDFGRFDGNSCASPMFLQGLDLLSFNCNTQFVHDYREHCVRNLTDILFYFGTLLGEIFRESSPIVQADRRVPSPSEALFVVDYKLEGWWNHADRFAANSPAQLLSQRSELSDPHYHKMARAAHASMLLKTVQSDNEWGSSHAFKYLKEELKPEIGCTEKIN